MKKLYLGIDGGGTKTKVIIIDENDKIIYEGIGGPSSIDTVSSDVTFKSIQEALTNFDSSNLSFEGVFAGIGGIVFKKDKQLVKKLIQKLEGVTKNTKIIAENDMHNALYSGLLFDEGMALIAGTGMVAFGKDLKGNTHKCAGWGYKEGEIGSGYSLGKFALSYMIRCYDGRLPMSDLAKEIAYEVELEKATDIIEIMDKMHEARTDVARLSPIVCKYANLGDSFAREFIDYATNEIKLAIKGVYTNISLKDKQLVIVGGLGNADGYFKEKLHQKILEIDPNIKIIAPKIDPALAAAMMAKKQ